MPGDLRIFAGAAAYESIRRNGFDAANVRVVAGAAGGPKWLALSRLDRVVFDMLSGPRVEPVHLIGTSIGSWRMSCLARIDPVAAITRFEEDYLDYDWGDVRLSADEVSRRTRQTLDTLMGDEGAAEMLASPNMRYNVIAVRCKGLTGSDRRGPLATGLVGVAAANLLSRRSLGLFFERALFSDPRSEPPFADANDFPMTRTPLTPANLMDAIMATSSIPIVMTGVSDIVGAPEGTYRDGGFTDYHFDLPFTGSGGANRGDDLVLYPHYRPRLVPGWFDKRLKWRRPSADNYAHTLVITPSDDFIERLPGGKLPDRGDFKRYNFVERQKIWRGVANECQRLADEFADLLAQQKLPERIERLPL